MSGRRESKKWLARQKSHWSMLATKIVQAASDAYEGTDPNDKGKPWFAFLVVQVNPEKPDEVKSSWWEIENNVDEAFKLIGLHEDQPNIYIAGVEVQSKSSRALEQP